MQKPGFARSAPHGLRSRAAKCASIWTPWSGSTPSKENPTFGAAAQSFLKKLRGAGHTTLVSHFLLAELLVLPIRDGDQFLIAAYKRAMLASASVEVVPFTAAAAATFATLRALQRTQPLDSIHLALAATAKADVFVTVDDRLHRLAVKGIGRIADLTYNTP